MTLWKLIFSTSVYKRYSKEFSWWFRPNLFLYPFAIIAIAFASMTFEYIHNGFFYFLLFPILYKILKTLLRLSKKSVPVYKRLSNLPNYDTPFFKLNVAIWAMHMIPVRQVWAMELMNPDDLKLHRRQQSARLLFYCLLGTSLSLVAF